MTGEEKKPEEKKPEEKKPEETTKPEEVKGINERMLNIEAQRMEEKKQELLEVEGRIDKKMTEFKKFVSDTELEGKSFAGQAVVPEETDEQRITRESKEILKGTGFEDMLVEDDASVRFSKRQQG